MAFLRKHLEQHLLEPKWLPSLSTRTEDASGRSPPRARMRTCRFWQVFEVPMEGLPPPARFYTAKKSTPSGERSTVKIVTFFSLPPPPPPPPSPALHRRTLWSGSRARCSAGSCPSCRRRCKRKSVQQWRSLPGFCIVLGHVCGIPCVGRVLQSPLLPFCGLVIVGSR